MKAKYPGFCTDCREPIRIGDDIDRCDDGWSHIECDGPLTVERPRGDTCPNCWTQRSLTGECLCEGIDR